MNPNPFITTFKRAKSAFLSGNSAAYLGIVIKLIRPVGLIMDSILAGKRNLDKQNTAVVPPCVMLVSPSRSGSTIIYQVLTRAFPCVYISNLHAIFPKNAFKYLLKKGSRSVSFNNYYGYTSTLRDVYEGNEIIEAIFRGNPSTIEIRNRFIRFTKMMGASEKLPLIFKNVSAYKNIYKLHQAVPELIFLRIRRDTNQVIQSMLKAYRELGYFYSTPEKVKKLNIPDPVEFTVLHLLGIEKEIDSQLQQISEENVIRWTYEDFCNNAPEMIENLVINYLKVESSSINHDIFKEPLQVSTRKKVEQEEAERIGKLVREHTHS